MKRSPTLRGRRALVALAALSTSGAYAAPAPAAAPAPDSSVSMAGGPSREVEYGRQLEIRGTFRPRAAGEIVRLEHARRGGEYRILARRQTRADGSYAFTPRVERTGSFRAVVDRTAASAPKRVVVVSSVSGRATRHVLGDDRARVRGALKPGQRGRSVKLQLASRGKWRTVDTARTGAGGRFTAAWRPREAGAYKLRLRSVGDRLAAGSDDRLAPVRAYRPGHASWYGPGLYGNRLGCGGTLTPSTLGVAHKSLPCGTKVTFRHHGRTATVSVVDRGPYVAGREWDLTEATKRKLGFGSTGTVWSTR